MEYYEVAAKWWADKIRNIGPANFNNGDDSASGGLLMVMATITAMDKQPDNEAVDLFEKKLAEEIKKYVEEDGFINFECDYSPSRKLAHIAKEVGIDPRSFPWKTSMTITADEVRVKNGYGSSYITIFPKR